MSNATFESPVAASQLFFAWSEQAEVGVAPPAPVRKKSAPRLAPAAAPAPTASPQTPAAPAVVLTPPTTAPTESAAQQVQRSSNPAGHLTFTSDGRIAQPVRIGSVMIKLLKRYGITDAEIAEGVASYARKHQRALAS